MGSRFGWFFGDYDYTRVLGPQLGTVPIVIPLMWFALCQGALVMASLLFWRRDLPAGPGWRPALLTAAMAALLVTAFDLGADPYFVFQLQAWIMEKKDGYWFGETVVGFAGWLFVSFTITALFLATGKGAGAAAAPAPRRRHAALAPIAVYAAMMAFQMAVGDPFELRVVSFFAMGVPALAAVVAWSQWDGAAPVEVRA
jgi:putative membrane protein